MLMIHTVFYIYTEGNNTRTNWGHSPGLGFVNSGSQTPKLRKYIYMIIK